ncbi:energy transducer TonB [Roseovarius sp. LXJ103]|uniref:energy transducer TonB n=1 Tax=Roseovarius carneus TaxID=2853164 RepID=UPI000D612BCE|nr:energy transducer TonB [Roseovarius carneus]MBZ8118590.1 energy transducer TonB [Roseovarius carneus]PWE37270.1 energy transducer TonB [Pelagicola sp. LXJ1103]
MNTGQIISGSAHIGLLGWALLGNMFSSDPLPFEVTQVTAISAEEYAALFDQTGPVPVPEVIAPEVPDAPDEAPPLSATPDEAPVQPAPEAAAPPEPDPAPEAVAPVEQAEAQDEAPVLEPPSEDVAALLPETAPVPQERPAERVAPEQVAPPEPETAVDDVVREQVVQDEAGETQAEQQEATAPEAAATEIVTEAEQAAPSASVRPRSRPAQVVAATPEPEPAPTVETAAQTPAAEVEDNSAVEAALAAALGGTTTPTPTVSSGPPLTRGEKDALRVSVQNCWNVGSLSSEALQTSVVVSVEMGEDSRPLQNSIRMESFSGGSAAAAQQAYEAARRAIIRCGARGFNLPADKFASWQTIEMTFNPENMRIK